MPPKNKISQTITNVFSNNLTSSKRKPFKTESDRRSELYKSIYKNFLKLKLKFIQHYSRFADVGPKIAERNIRSSRNFLKKPVFEKKMLIDYLNYHLL